jgi:hypothetical protein
VILFFVGVLLTPSSLCSGSLCQPSLPTFFFHTNLYQKFWEWSQHQNNHSPSHPSTNPAVAHSNVLQAGAPMFSLGRHYPITPSLINLQKFPSTIAYVASLKDVAYWPCFVDVLRLTPLRPPPRSTTSPHSGDLLVLRSSNLNPHLLSAS